MKKFLLSLIMVVACGSVVAQPADKKWSPEKQKQRLEKRSNHLANELKLDDATAAWFKPLYVEYVSKMKEECMKQKCQKPQSDDEIIKQMEGCLERQETILKIKRTYFKKFQQKLTARQLQTVMKQDCMKPAMGKKHGKMFKKGKGHKNFKPCGFDKQGQCKEGKACDKHPHRPIHQKK